MVLQGTSGQLGKQLLLKQYAYGAVLSKYPDMSAVKPSEKQIEGYDKFRVAVAYAQSIINDAKKKKAYQKKLKPGQTVYHFAIREYLQNH